MTSNIVYLGKDSIMLITHVLKITVHIVHPI